MKFETGMIYCKQNKFVYQYERVVGWVKKYFCGCLSRHWVE